MRRRMVSGRADIPALQRSIQRFWTPRSRWHIGDLAWAGTAIAGHAAAGRAACWADDRDDVQAWAWVDPDGEVDLHVDPAHPELIADVLAWCDSLARYDRLARGDRLATTITIMQTDRPLSAALTAAGYRPAPDAPFFQHCLLDLVDPPAVPRLPAGYRLRTVRADEAPARAAVHRAAWRPGRIGALLVPPVDLGDGQSGVTTEAYQAVMDSWPYRSELDHVVEAPDGTLVASALGWLDAANRAGELEPVGTDPAHARLGLGRAVSLAGLHALRAAGATRAVVYPRGDDAYPVPRHLYHALGFRSTTRTVTYARPL